ncbi:type I-E CRISPR-associated endoribonuclease Cas2e [Dehalococcoides mccartyi]|uniref:type I-E CRISPR-associated endoribonuclease Cas2e n=1 Tax=Dehalococcoides mccartyi TaxID=61435 RepID=UPI0032208B7F
MILEKVPTSLRGALSRWLLEPKTGVFLGNPSARVRDELWDKAIKKTKASGVILQIWTDQNPQGFLPANMVRGNECLLILRGYHW